MGRHTDALPAHESLSPSARQGPPRRSRPFTFLWVAAGVILCMLVTTGVIALWRACRVGDIGGGVAALETSRPEAATPTRQLGDTLQSAQALAHAPIPDAAAVVPWPRIATALSNYAPERLYLTSISQDGDWLSVAGRARSCQDVVDYATSLERAAAFENVVVESITQVTTPSIATWTPHSPGDAPDNPTPTPVVPDTYEPDEDTPRPIVEGEIQWHTFYPANDVDRVTFWGQPGRSYCIQALPQSAGADPALEVTVDGALYANVNCRSTVDALGVCPCPMGTAYADLGATVLAHVAPGTAQQVDIGVLNRGEYGPEQWYTLLITEALPDPWEPDDLHPTAISPGEVQTRTFYPLGDVDRATFAVVAGRAYEVRAKALSADADPVLTLFANGTIYQNDNSASGDPSAYVAFVATSTGTATLAVTNRGQFGAGATYRLEVVGVTGDQYEPDDQDPKILALWEQQHHTFFPDGDIDRAEFSVKAGRVYQVETRDLSVGVDTILSVLVGGTAYRNDDAAPGQRSSRVSFRSENDGVALVTVTNCGQFGSDMGYTLTVRESTGAPSPTPSAPPCTDGYEPDDIIPQIIAVGESFVHSFCPDGDMDRAVFTAKAGHAYYAETFGLSRGVDTVLSIQIGQTSQTNDDRAPHDPSSAMAIVNATGADAPAYVLVCNKGLDGPDATYTLWVRHIGMGNTYEPDDKTLVSVTVGTSQTRTLYRPRDADRVTFVAKPGHRFRINTDQVSAPIDTTLQVRMGDAYLVNDDRQRGVPASYLEPPNDGVDTRAYVNTFGDDTYEPDVECWLVIDDLGTIGHDTYEPAEEAIAPLCLSEVQRHRFYPEGDDSPETDYRLPAQEPGLVSEAETYSWMVRAGTTPRPPGWLRGDSVQHVVLASDSRTADSDDYVGQALPVSFVLRAHLRSVQP